MGAVLGEVTVRMNVSEDFYGIPTKMRLYPAAHALKKAFIVGAGLMCHDHSIHRLQTKIISVQISVILNT